MIHNSFDVKPYFKFTQLNSFKELEGKKIKKYDETNHYKVILTEDNCLLAFYSEAIQDYSTIEINSGLENIHEFYKGIIPKFFIENDLIDVESYNKDFEEYSQNLLNNMMNDENKKEIAELKRLIDKHGVPPLR